ncbi:MAG TPA: outer membrane protein assembly factor BamA [Erythrobacter sp.]|jgi:outer membrane protein insertion porin family|uniref:outer membrane protein assembly factor BamA n=1 Tax=Erythrobacteraceae TaxID=335929 RepID=UPI0007B9EDBE|nr:MULTISPECIES: outer membrane protein assembly factor BamA [unclassified Erythrobacter]MAG05202.1 outer membrane protein assembly factor BamA [Sphingomonadaceae bacterium]RZP19818.1 MAG: outer membrane protein assembly factor BamA [Erythrobacter sp.]KZY92804.1 outer membrane protein assembly factor BamA [Erythrobacter sp. HI0074]KZZ04485.1 outer membrane protein assembly factor BamA [Erythrobacter sp. HI0077]HBM06059.1 outer membrane protein assembly factor BamA [Erythrobacter sp.]|tara:strand:+ start:3548 stop:6250 length:2703 start_codon:yes stop_codon:yes gene_type:complete
MTDFAFAASRRRNSATRLAVGLLAGTMLAGVPVAAFAQEETATEAAPAAAVQADVVRTIAVSGAQRLEPQTILSYIKLRPGDTWTQAAGDAVLKDLYATELFSNASVVNRDGNVVITIVENPVINRIILEGNKRIKNDKILPEIRLSPRQIFTRSKVRADVARIIELYKRQGRFAATVEPKMVQLSQNRVDIVFEISEGPKSKVRQINIIGNDAFSDGELRGEMLTKQARLTSFFSSNTSYDPDRLAFDQQKLRQFYLTEGYADFRVVSAVAELTPDKRDFIITYVVEEGERYKFGEVDVESQIRDFDDASMTARLPMQGGDWYDAKQVEDTVEQLSELAGTFGYAFADVAPEFSRNQDSLTMDVSFVLREAPRVYVERIDVNGNTLTQDKVIRREFRLAEGDAFNSLSVARSTARINSLGYFQENFEINQVEGSAPDRIVLEANVEEQATGELQLSAGFSSLESFILAGSIRQRNFRGRGQTVGLSLNYSRYSKSAQVSFSEPYVFDRNISAGVDIYRRDTNSFNFRNNERNTTFEQSTTGLQVRAGVPLTEYVSAIGSYTFNYDDVSLDEGLYFSDRDGDGIATCDPILASRYLCEAIGERTSSIVGLTFNYDTLNSRLRPSRGETVSWTTEFAGLGGDVKYVRSRARAAKYWPVGAGFIFSVTGEGGWIRSLEDNSVAGQDDVRLTDRYFLGEPQMRGFDIRGVGPRIVRLQYLNDDGDDATPLVPQTIEEALASDQRVDDALGGKAYYLGRAELEIPLGSGAREMGLRPSIFLDVGSLFSVTQPVLQDYPNGLQATDGNGNLLYLQPGVDDQGNDIIQAVTNRFAPDGTENERNVIPGTFFKEVFVGDSPAPRISVGVGVNWNSPFGPFRIDVSRVLKKQVGDDTKTFSFNVGTQF